MEMIGSLVLALWLPEGKWEYRIDPPRVAKGQKHVHMSLSLDPFLEPG
jgi:hypothetical protein